MRTPEEILSKLEELLELDEELLAVNKNLDERDRKVLEQLIKIDKAIIDWIKN